MKIYIAASSQTQAKAAADLCVAAGHTITSRWLDVPFDRTVTYTEDQRREIAQYDYDDVVASDALVCLESDHLIPGGKFVEVGIALGTDKLVVAIGKRENMLMWHPAISACKSVEEFIELHAIAFA